jgi:hypothetical protein
MYALPVLAMQVYQAAYNMLQKALQVQSRPPNLNDLATRLGAEVLLEVGRSWPCTHTPGGDCQLLLGKGGAKAIVPEQYATLPAVRGSLQET